MSDPTPLGPIAFGILQGGTGVSSAVKQAILDCFEHAAWADDQGQTYYNALLNAFYPFDHITAVYTQSGTVYDTDSLDSLKTDLVVTAVYESGVTKTIDAADYTLSGTLEVGTSTITVSYGGKTATFDVVVSPTYQRVEWIASNGKCKIEPNFKLPSSYRIEAKTKLDSYQSGYNIGNVVQSFNTQTSTYGLQFGYSDASGSTKIIAFSGVLANLTPSDATAEIVIGCICNASTIQPYEVVSGERVLGTSANVTRSFYTDYNMKIFSGGGAADANYYLGRIYYVEIYDASDNMIANFVPCYRLSDESIGMLEMVSKVFYENSGAGTFTKGGDVS